MSGNAATAASAADVWDWRLIATFVGIAVSLVWNWLNWRRGSLLNQAVRFEAVHGDALKDVIETLADASKKARELQRDLDTVVGAPDRITIALRSTISEASHKFSTEIERVADSKLSRDRDRWIKLAKSDQWDKVWECYTKARGNEQLLGIKAQLQATGLEMDQLSSAITTARTAENETRFWPRR